MKRIATWIRDPDEPHFARFFAERPGVALVNARDSKGTGGELEAPAAVLLTGGPDIAAEFHVEPPADCTLIRKPDPVRDAWEIRAVRLAVERGLPLFCICKGMQVLNVALGGTLHLDIRGHDAPELKSRNVQRLRHDRSARHRFTEVNSSHHQAINRLADRLEIEAWCAADDIVEQVRVRDHPFALGVQYHPERDLGYRALFDDFVGHIGK
ncbi:MAG TPA: type 1 glutamine amidotransferase [Chthoniobacteraceae bacterium]|nr:type 1 glutamine amidotransferase [Chthoniobacteraceae bacterium]